MILNSMTRVFFAVTTIPTFAGMTAKTKLQKSAAGFTLLEILIALFIFSIVSMILVGALRNVIDAQSGMENKAERLRHLQRVLLVMSRDIEQAVNRPVIDATGKEERAFIGSEHQFTFTHAGFANATQALTRSSLQRVGYQWNNDNLIRISWPVLDQAPTSAPDTRRLLSEVTSSQFEYLDQDGRFSQQWPIYNNDNSQILPRAIRVSFTFAHWGTITQLYLIPAQSLKPPVILPPAPNDKGDKH